MMHIIDGAGIGPFRGEMVFVSATFSKAMAAELSGKIMLSGLSKVLSGMSDCAL